MSASESAPEPTPAALDPDIATMLDRVRRAARPPFWTMTPDEARSAYRRASRVLDIATRPLARVETHALPTRDGTAIPMRLVAPELAGPAPLVVYFHGGGFTIGGTDTHDAFCRMLADDARCAVASIDYRLAPEHRFPTAVEDAEDALLAIVARAEGLGLDAARLVIAGDSAGGTLAAVTAIRARDLGIAVRLQLLLYPGTKRDADTDSHRRLAAGGYLLDEPTFAWFMDGYAPTATIRDDWRFAPLDGRGPGDGPIDLAGVAPTVVVTAGFDPLHDEGVAYARRLVEAGVAVRHLDYPGLIHGFLLFAGAIPAARVAQRDLVVALRAALAVADDGSLPRH